MILLQKVGSHQLRDFISSKQAEEASYDTYSATHWACTHVTVHLFLLVVQHVMLLPSAHFLSYHR